ncbi:MAG TPA: hypothetical protein DEA97_06215 [Bacteroidales bacterium]|nr:hypothetical protein [Bacteroidales bacterium]
MKKAIFFVLILSFGTLMAQQIKIDKNKALNWTFHEKVKISKEQLMRQIEQSPELKEKYLKETKGVKAVETNITNSEKLEAEIHAAINPTDSTNIVVSPIRQDPSAGSMSCPVYYTKDFGTTWNESSFVNMPYEAGLMSGGGGDPVFAFDSNGKLYFTWIDLYGDIMGFLFGTVNMGIFWAYSEDGGETWIKPTRDTVLLGSLNMTMGSISGINSAISDKQWMACDLSGGTYANNLYISYVTIDQDGDGNAIYSIKCKTKPAAEDYFTHETAVSLPASFPFVQFSSLTVDNTGNVHVVFYGIDAMQTHLGLWHSVSTDGGLTFSEPNLISDVCLNLPILGIEPQHEIPGIDTNRLYPCPYMSGDPVGGNLYVTWTAFGALTDAGHGAEIFFSKSSDNGASWSFPLRVNSDPFTTEAHNYYSSIFVKPNGDIKVSWYDRRDDPTNNLITHYYYATSSNFGSSFGTNYQASSVPTDFSTIGSQNSNFGIGEYTQVLASSGYTIPVWCDGRGNDGLVNVYMAFINDNPTGIYEVSPVTDKLSVSTIFPNPVSDEINFNITLAEASEVDLTIVDITGKAISSVSKGTYTKGKHTINLKAEELSAGKYFLNVRTSLGNSVRAFMVK